MLTPDHPYNPCRLHLEIKEMGYIVLCLTIGAGIWTIFWSSFKTPPHIEEQFEDGYTIS